jgi:hypothetical protein
MHPNYDPRDDTHVRPQVSFRLKPGSFNVHEFLTSLRERLQSYHDMGLFDPTDGEVPGVVRFAWDTPRSVVDNTADWLRSLPNVLRVAPHYGGPIGAA